MIDLAIVLPVQSMGFENMMIPWYDISKIIDQSDKITNTSISMLVSLSFKSVHSVRLDKDHRWDFGLHSVFK